MHLSCRPLFSSLLVASALGPTSMYSSHCAVATAIDLSLIAACPPA
jgi:hypothetical protein